MRKASSHDPAVALDQAQDVIYEAWEAGSTAKRVALAKRALGISPRCADAYVLLAEHAKPGSDEALELWRKGAEAGEQALGKAAFDEMAGEFWGFLETRPYMRARFGLACALWLRSDRSEAIDHLHEMLRLNPNDNQGARYILAAWLIETGRDKDLDALLANYPDDDSAAWSWSAALAAHRRGGDSAKSRKLLARANRGNPHVRAYLLGERKTPKRLPPYYSPGEDSEAVHDSAQFQPGWSATPGALDWLRLHAEAKDASDVRKTGRRSAK